MKGPHGEVVRAAVVDSELLVKAVQGIELVAGIKPLVVLPVAAFHFSVVPGRVRADELMAGTRQGSCLFV